MAGIGGYTPGSTGADLRIQDWLAGAEVPIYEKMQFIPSLDDVGRPYSQKNLRVWDSLTPNELSSSTLPSNANITWESGSPNTLPLTPTVIYCGVAYGKNMQDEVEFDLGGGGIRANIEAAMAEGCDVIATEAISSLTLGIGDVTTVPTAAKIHAISTALRIACPSAEVGTDVIHACLHPGAMEGLQNDGQLMGAEYRGDAENPAVRGIFSKVGGILFRFTTKVPTGNGNGGEGAVYVPSAFAVGWNSKPSVTQDKEPLATMYVGYASLGCIVKWDSRARYFRTVITSSEG